MNKTLLASIFLALGLSACAHGGGAPKVGGLALGVPRAHVSIPSEAPRLPVGADIAVFRARSTHELVARGLR